MRFFLLFFALLTPFRLAQAEDAQVESFDKSQFKAYMDEIPCDEETFKHCKRYRLQYLKWLSDAFDSYRGTRILEHCAALHQTLAPRLLCLRYWDNRNGSVFIPGIQISRPWSCAVRN